MVFETFPLVEIGVSEIFKIAMILLLGILLAFISKFFIRRMAEVFIYPSVRKDSPKNYKRVISGMDLVVQAVFWIIVLVFLFQGLAVLNISFFDRAISLFAGFLPRLAVAFVVFVIGFLTAGIISRSIQNSDIIGNSLISKLFSIVFITATVLSALEIVGISLTAFLYVFLISVAGIALAVSIAIGLAFGFALKPHIGKVFNRIKKDEKSSKK